MNYKVGQIFKTVNVIGHIHELKILAISENKWLMVRYTGCVPFCKSVKEFPKYLEQVNGSPKNNFKS